MEFNIFKVEYDWYEEEHEETLLSKNVEREEFEKDLIEAKKFAKSLISKKTEKGDYLGKGYSVECLPEYYEQVVWFLTEKKEYSECNFDEDITYNINDSENGEEIQINKCEEQTKITEL